MSAQDNLSVPQFSPLKKWGKDKPHQAAMHIAQEATRLDEPRMTMPLPEPNFAGFSHGAEPTLHHMLRQAGYPDPDEAFVSQKPEGHTASSVAYSREGAVVTPGVALVRQRFDYGTLAHEAAHLVTMHENNWDFNDRGLPDSAVHGPQFAGNYARVIGNSWGKDAGDTFRRHHEDAVKLVSNFRRRVHNLPGIDE